MLFRRFVDMSKYKEVQVKTFTDTLYLVDTEDKITGKIDKKTAHLNNWIYGKEGKPHRAFSVFLFNSFGELLLQQRSAIKVTFPLYWTNSCCSHPIKEVNEEGVLNEAIERTKFELGIQVNLIENNGRKVGKILYKAKSDETWGEYELDHLFFFKINKESSFAFNKDEIENTRWIKRQDVQGFIKQERLVTPWFKAIVEKTDFTKWWESYLSGELSLKDNNKIINLT